LTLIDFNVAKRFIDIDTGNPLRMMTNTGTAKYMAPEMLSGWMSHYDERIDLWSAGCVLYYLLTGGMHAFDYELRADIEDHIRMGAFGRDKEEYLRVNPEAKDLIECLLRVDPEDRMTASEALEHSWLSSLKHL
jgi:serine/threonine protein kinase